MSQRLDERDALSVRLAPGVALFATASGLLARTRKHWVRVDTRDRVLERNIVERLGAGAIISLPTYEKTIEALRRAELVRDDASGLGCSVDSDRELPDRVGEALVLVGSPDDASMGERLRAVLQSGLACATAWIDEQGVAVAYDDGRSRGCPLCVWMHDSALSRYVAVGVDLQSAPRAYGDIAALREVARCALEARGAAEPARLWTYDHATQRRRSAHIVPYPQCPCASRPRQDDAAAPRAVWDTLQGRRHAPVWPVPSARDGGVARVLYRRSRVPWLATADALGVAMAGGERAEVRALAEGIERYCLLHKGPDLRALAADDLEDAIDDSDIRTLLFRREESSRDGFRLAPFDRAEPIDWCRAIELASGRARWTPASLAGRALRGSRALVDATSNGYAAHVDREEAIDRALLELIERDAVLLHWYAPLDAWPVIDANVDVPNAHVLLATQDIDLPVVLAIAVQEDGSMRCGAAADVSFDRALSRATAELRVALGGHGVVRAPVDLDDPTRRYEPDDHMLHYAGPRGIAKLRDLVVSAPVISAATLRQRWPDTSERRRALLDALSARGLRAWIVDRSLPEVFGAGWHVVRALVPGLVELSWGLPFRRLASPRVLARLERGAVLSRQPHPIA